MQAVVEKIANSLYSEDCYNKEHSRIYKLHKYWARKPWYIVERYIENYSIQGDLVMDPFCGSGCTGLEAVINGRNFIGQDLNPTALRVTRGTLENNVSLDDLKCAFEQIENICKNHIMTLYVSEKLCSKCGGQLYYKHINLGPHFKDELFGSVYCPTCKTKGERKTLSQNELSAMESANKVEITKWVPDIPFPEKFYKDRFSYKGIHTVADMYTHRNLYALSILLEAIEAIENIKLRDVFLLAFSNTVLHVSKLKGENVRPLGVNNYWIPDDYIEENVWFRFEDRVNNILKAKTQQKKREKEKNKLGITTGKWSIEKKSALDSMGNSVVDYFFTDPPYGDAIQYSELSYVWNAWFRDKYEIEQEVIINPMQKKGAEEFNALLGKSLEQMYSALKEDKYLTLCFQNKNSSIWNEIIRKCKSLGFALVDISIYNTYGSPFNKSWANFSPKADIYVTFKKGKALPDEFYNENESISSIIREVYEYMEANNIPQNNNKLYDLTIAYLIWAMYYNLNEIDIHQFNIKQFTAMAEKILSKKQEHEQISLF